MPVSATYDICSITSTRYFSLVFGFGVDMDVNIEYVVILTTVL